MKIDKINPAGVFLISLVLLQTLELSAGQIVNRIVNHDAKRRLPWLVRITERRTSGLCGGTLLTSRVVLSAAHCHFYDSGHSVPSQMMHVYLGDYDARTQDSGEERAEVSRYINHPQFIKNTYDNDLSLIFLNRDIRFTATIYPACLANPGRNYENTQVTAAGWGKDEKGDLNNILKQVDLTTMNNQRCNYLLRNGLPDYLLNELLDVSDNMICAKGHFKGTCHGDSGGPLMLKGSKTVIGVTSWGQQNCNLNAPSVFARVSSKLSWIKAYAGRICIN